MRNLTKKQILYDFGLENDDLVKNKNIFLNMKYKKESLTYNIYPTSENIYKIDKIIGKYGQKIVNYGPVFEPNKNFKKIEGAFKFEKIDFKNAEKYKKYKFIFDFDDPYFNSKFAYAYYDDKKLIGLGSFSKNSKYFWEFSCQKFSKNPKYKKIMAYMLNNMTYEILKNNKEIMPITASQFSHIDSMNLSINAGYSFAFTFISIDNK
ncbi:MAG: hypothetical protein E6706_06755 [Anaerococcus hydrogenalis]|nr:hypothetical protein [Anaerococcus hydrogenalis]